MGNRISKHVHQNAVFDQYTYYVRDASGNVLSIYQRQDTFIATPYNRRRIDQIEAPLYGSSRLGLHKVKRLMERWEINGIPSNISYSSIYAAETQDGLTTRHSRTVGHKYYELSNHLGNVLATISDRKLVSIDGSGSPFVITGYVAEVLHAQDYFPFGMAMPGRSYEAGDYRFGFQGQEQDDEVKGTGNSVNYKYRVHDPRLGRFLSIDPLAPDYPMYSPYHFSSNQPIHAEELEGLESRWDLNSSDPNYMALKERLRNAPTTTKVASGYEVGLNMNHWLVQAPSRNVAQGLYSGILRNQYEFRVGQLKSLWLAGSESNKGPWSEGLKTRFDIKTETRKWMSLTPSMQYAMDNAHLPERYHPLFRRFVDDRFKIDFWTVESPEVQARITSSGKPPRFYTSNRSFNLLGRANTAAAIAGIGVSAYNIHVAENKGEQTAIEGGKWAGAWIGAEIFGGATASVAPHPILVGGASIVGGVIGGVAGEEAVRRALDAPSVTPGWQTTTCFVAGTKVLMYDGTEKEIEEVKANDIILSVDISTMTLEADTVVLIPAKVKVYRKIRAEFSNGIMNEFSPAHPYFVKGKGWCVFDTDEAKQILRFEVDQLEIGDTVYYFEAGQLHETSVTDLYDTGERVEMYNVEFVKNNNTFFANGILVHNKL